MTNPPYILEHLEAMSDILNHPRVFSFLHVPVQSGSNPVLDKMNREYTREDFEEVCDALIAGCPDVTLATDIICGFPYETSEQFDETLTLVDKYRFPIINISQFYPRPGTPAAKWKRVPTKEVKERSGKVTKLFNSYTCYDQLLNSEQRVWILERDPKHKDQLVAHTKSYQKVLIPYKEGLLGKQAIVRVDKTDKWHVEATVIELDPEPEPVSETYWEDYRAAREKPA